MNLSFHIYFVGLLLSHTNVTSSVVFDELDIRNVQRRLSCLCRRYVFRFDVAKSDLHCSSHLNKIFLDVLLALNCLSVVIGISHFRCSRHKGSVSAFVQVEFFGDILTFMNKTLLKSHPVFSFFFFFSFSLFPSLFPSLSRATMRATQTRPTSLTTAITVSRRRE